MKGVLSNFANFTGKHLAQLAKFLRTPSLTEHLRWLLLDSDGSAGLMSFVVVEDGA